MKSINKIVVTIFVLGLAACAPQGQQDSKANNADISTGIIGGLEVPANYPLANHVVALYSPTQQFMCTGTLMENNFVLTAAHCIPQDGKLIVMFGVNIRAPNVFKLPSDAAVFHPNWNPKALGQENLGDIAVGGGRSSNSELCKKEKRAAPPRATLPDMSAMDCL